MRIDSRDGDELVFAALRELDSNKARSVVPVQASRERLERVLESLVVLRQRGGLRQWQGVCEVSAAVQPLEDELFTQGKELKRAHAMLKNVVVQQQQRQPR